MPYHVMAVPTSPGALDEQHSAEQSCVLFDIMALLLSGRAHVSTGS